MKRIFLFSLLLCLGMGSVSAQTENKSKSDQRKLLEAQEGAQKFQMAKIALNSRNFVWEFYDPRSTDKSKVCYNFMRVQGDSIFFQAAWSAQGMRREGFRQSVGKIDTFTMIPDKKGNIKITLVAQMTDVQSAWRSTWTLTRTFKLFRGSNYAPWMGSWVGYIVLPSQSNALELNGSMRPYVP